MNKGDIPRLTSRTTLKSFRMRQEQYGDLYANDLLLDSEIEHYHRLYQKHKLDQKGRINHEQSKLN